jgi:phosphoribosylanthranilate isomerase
MRTRVKICGLKEPGHVEAAVDAGADAVGFVLYPLSPRAVTPGLAARLARVLPAFVTPVVLFVEPSLGEIEEVLRAIPNACVQFHGRESPGFCEQWSRTTGRSYLRAVPIPAHDAASVDLVQWSELHPSAAALVLDTQSSGHGGSGQTFDWNSIAWSRLPPDVRARIVLSGGLCAANVAEGIRRVRPYAVDVSSGVESAQRGLKDVRKIREFIAAVRSADLELAAGDVSDEPHDGGHARIGEG